MTKVLFVSKSDLKAMKAQITAYKRLNRFDQAEIVPSLVPQTMAIVHYLLENGKKHEAKELLVEKIEEIGGCDHSGMQGTRVCVVANW